MISPSLAQRRGQAWMVFGSMGGDLQDQWQLQFFLNRYLFEMPLQQAIEAPKFGSEHFPDFFAPLNPFIKSGLPWAGSILSALLSPPFSASSICGAPGAGT